MPTFLEIHDIYRMIQRELPDSGYPDGSPSAWFSTADSGATAKCISTLYKNMQLVYNNEFPQTANEQIADWEVKVFGAPADSSVPLESRQQRIINQLQWQKTLDKTDILAICAIAVGDLDMDIRFWNGDPNGVWVLGESQLGVTTFLGGSLQFRFGQFSPLCQPNAVALGITQQQLSDMQSNAYTYEVVIYDYTLTASQYATLDKYLTRYEPARSAHVITSGVSSVNKPGGDT